MSREAAYQMVQRNALKVWKQENTTFLEEVKKDRDILNYISSEELYKICNLENRIKNTNVAFKRLRLT